MVDSSFFKKILLVAAVVFLYSCDKDYNVIGDDLVGDGNFALEDTLFSVLSYNQKITPVQSNNMSINALGIYDDPAFGTTTANFVTQVYLESYAPTIGDAAVIESVVLTIPYSSHVVKINQDGSSEYALDSIAGPAEGKLKLSIFESGYYLRNLDPDSNFENQTYYTDQKSAIVAAIKTATRLNNSANKKENDEFFFDKAQIVTKTTDTDTEKETTTYTAPQMQLNLDKDFFQEKILNASASNLATADAFTNYFRGLYFAVEKSGNSASNLAMLNFAEGTITVNYKAKTAITTDEESTKEDKKIVIKFKTGTSNVVPNTISLLEETSAAAAYTTATTTANKADGDNTLYLKGGQGSMAVISLFSKPGELEDIRSKGWLVNEANLTFHIDADQMKNAKEPSRIYLYDLNNNRAIVDFLVPELFDGAINKDATSKRGTTYKIRLTDHIRNLVKNADSTNVKLGLVVSQSANILGFAKLRTPNEVSALVPNTSVSSPLGTVLYGGTTNVPAEKRLKLQIFYTKPN